MIGGCAIACLRRHHAHAFPDTSDRRLTPINQRSPFREVIRKIQLIEQSSRLKIDIDDFIGQKTSEVSRKTIQISIHESLTELRTD